MIPGQGPPLTHSLAVRVGWLCLWVWACAPADDLDQDVTDLSSERVEFVRPMTDLEWQVQRALQKHGGKSKFAQLAKVRC